MQPTYWCDVWDLQKEGRMTADTVAHQDYPEVKGERYEVKKPKDSDVLKGDGSFLAETDKGMEYTAKKGERYETIKQDSSDIWKVGFQQETNLKHYSNLNRNFCNTYLKIKGRSLAIFNVLATRKNLNFWGVLHLYGALILPQLFNS